MKKVYTILAIAAMSFLTSCGGIFRYVQVFEAQPIEPETSKYNGGLLFQNEDCAIFYSFWSNGGDASFEIYNKTDKIIYLDLTKSFFIRNGLANDYYKARTWSVAKSKTSIAEDYVLLSATQGTSYDLGTTYIGKFGQAPNINIEPILSRNNTTSYGALRSTYLISESGVLVEEKPVVAIPPKSSKIIISYSINSIRYLDCDLDRYPKDTDKITFTQDNSPIKYTNYITYNLGEGTEDLVIKNNFYISSITNYAFPSIIKFQVKNYDECENKRITYHTYDGSPLILYDPCLLIDNFNLFYINYEVQSPKILYKTVGPKVVYDPDLKAYKRAAY